MSSCHRMTKAVVGALAVVAFMMSSAQASAATAPSAKHQGRATFSPAQATAAFGLSLMRRLPSGNLVFSPDSVAAAMAMTGTGAAGQTATQIARALDLSSPASFAAVGRLQLAIAAEQDALAHGSPEAPILNIANGLFVQQGFALQAPFAAGLAQSFGASPQPVDFQSPSATDAINGWISQQTHGLIPHLVAGLPAATRLALANAIYLKAAWGEEFKPGATGPAPFHETQGASSTDFMHETGSFPYVRGAHYAALSLPYRDSTLSLLVVLPVGESLAKLERRLDAPMLEGVAHGLRTRPVLLSLPRFHLQTEATLDAPLQRLGITNAFIEGRADFSRIAQSEPLAIGQILHAADFKVDEQGTEAAAATVVTIEATSARGYSRPPVPFNANHPFIFFLRDDKSGAVLFAGRLVKPQD
jgi:serpin B